VGEGLFASLNGKKMEEVPLAQKCWGCPTGDLYGFILFYPENYNL